MEYSANVHEIEHGETDRAGRDRPHLTREEEVSGH